MEIRNVMEYWESLHKIDRCSLLETIYIDSELGNYKYEDLHGHIRLILVSLFNYKWKHQTHELTF
jgi:hypothetical protein